MSLYNPPSSVSAWVSELTSFLPSLSFVRRILPPYSLPSTSSSSTEPPEPLYSSSLASYRSSQTSSIQRGGVPHGCRQRGLFLSLCLVTACRKEVTRKSSVFDINPVCRGAAKEDCRALLLPPCSSRHPSLSRAVVLSHPSPSFSPLLPSNTNFPFLFPVTTERPSTLLPSPNDRSPRKTTRSSRRASEGRRAR